MLLTWCYSLTHNFSLPRVTGCLRSPDREKTVSRNARKRYVSERACFYISKGEKPRNFMGLEAKSYSTINRFVISTPLVRQSRRPRPASPCRVARSSPWKSIRPEWMTRGAREGRERSLPQRRSDG